MLAGLGTCRPCRLAGIITLRTAYSLLVLLIVAVVAFVGLRLAPGDVTTQLVDPIRATPAELAALRRQLGLDEPIVAQFWLYLGGLVRGDFGISLLTREPVSEIVLNAAFYTLTLAVAAFALSAAGALPLGILAATMRGSWVDRAIMFGSATLMALPNFVLAILLVTVFAVNAGWLPVAGTGSWRHLVLPAIVLAADPLAFATRLVRTSYLEQASAAYPEALRLRGIPERAIRWRHILRNALLPVISFAAVQVRTLVGYTLIVEVIFRWPGLGKRLVDSILARDYQVAQGLTILLALTVVVSTLVSKILYQLADPRVREA
jgi:ABC-type dipeptide/oligopeptide/nickel transport system permease component